MNKAILIEQENVFRSLARSYAEERGEQYEPDRILAEEVDRLNHQAIDKRMFEEYEEKMGIERCEVVDNRIKPFKWR